MIALALALALGATMADPRDTDLATLMANRPRPDLTAHPEDLHPDPGSGDGAPGSRPLAQLIPPRPAEPAAPRDDSRDWTGLNTGLEAAFVAGQFGDWRQTQEISRLARRPYYGGPPLIHEMNPILGPRPSAAAVNIYFPAATLAQYAVARALSHPWRELWQLGGIGLEGWAIQNNLRMRTPQTPNGIGFNLGLGGHF